jgi:hypothetical protein
MAKVSGTPRRRHHRRKNVQPVVENLEGRIAKMTKSSQGKSRALKSRKWERQTIIDIILNY